MDKSCFFGIQSQKSFTFSFLIRIRNCETWVKAQRRDLPPGDKMAMLELGYKSLSFG
jgi:hypothetical protein